MVVLGLLGRYGLFVWFDCLVWLCWLFCYCVGMWFRLLLIVLVGFCFGSWFDYWFGCFCYGLLAGWVWLWCCCVALMLLVWIVFWFVCLGGLLVVSGLVRAWAGRVVLVVCGCDVYGCGWRVGCSGCGWVVCLIVLDVVDVGG